MNPRRTKKKSTLTYFTAFLGHHRRNLYVHFLCKLLTYGHRLYQDYKSLCAAVTICATLANIQTDTRPHRQHFDQLV